jgi:hypothetical protein
MPKALRQYFWDVGFEKLDDVRHADIIIERVLEYGTMKMVRWLRDHYGDARIRRYIIRSGYRRLSPKTLNFWKLMLHLTDKECPPPSSRRNSKKFWVF